MTEADYIILELLQIIKYAIKDGDWKVDGSCDPDLLINRAENYLKDKIQ